MPRDPLASRMPASPVVPPVGTGSPRLVCLVGAECTGKTTLAHNLAQHFSGLWVPEYLREFCQTQGRTPRCDEQQHILQTQLAQEEAALAQAAQQGKAFVFCDTPALLTAIYSAHYFSDPSLLPQARAWQSHYALTLLLSPDLPWVADGAQRDGVEVQSAVHAQLLRELQTLPFPYVVVSGQGADRVRSAVAAVNTFWSESSF